ncbi:MAG: FHA domain-containing protein, partial [Pyrinomonadaceae bacterium]|nr:FHA domain-containing protein [Pyrinomonadaceae bacterium]
MARLIFKNQHGEPERVELSRLRTTIGRSARSDVCIPDAFASRLHAEVRLEGDMYWLQDLGSANGTRYNGAPVKTAVPLSNGGEIQIGETRITFDAGQEASIGNATLIADRTEALDPSKTISFQSRRIPTTELLQGQFSSRTDLLGLISKVGVALLSASGLDETLNQVASLVFEAVPAERCVIMLRDETNSDEMRIRVARIRGKEETLNEVRVSHSVMDEVLKNGKSVLTADAQQDPRFATQTMVLQGIRSVLAVPLSVDAVSYTHLRAHETA